MQASRPTTTITCILLAVLAIAQASCFSEPDIYTVSTEVTPEGDVISEPRAINLAQHRRETQASGPRVRVENPVHDFGRLDPLTKHQHTFIIYNEGTEPLELTEGPTTCKCTVANLVGGSVPPGGKAHVVMQWNTGRDEGYSHSATVYTNDPRQRIVQLRIKGQVQVLLRCEPHDLVLSRVAPGETPSASTLIYSQMWDEFELPEIKPSLPGVTVEVEPASAAEMKELEAKSARRLTVTLPDDLPSGYFTIPIQIEAEQVMPDATGEAARVDTELVLQGKVLRRLSVYGPAVDIYGTVLMGRVLQGRGAQVSLMLKMRDPQTELTVTKIETIPESLNVRLEPMPIDEDRDAGLYRLHLELPREAPPFRLPPNQRGKVYIEFDHPRVPSLDLALDLIVTPRADAHR